MPLMAYLTFDEPSKPTRGDLIRLGLVTQPWDSDTLPFTEGFGQILKENIAMTALGYAKNPWSTTRMMCTGQNFIVIGSQKHRVFANDKSGIKHNY